MTEDLYHVFRDRMVTVIFQNWEGDWLLRGRAGDDLFFAGELDDLPELMSTGKFC